MGDPVDRITQRRTKVTLVYSDVPEKIKDKYDWQWQAEKPKQNCFHDEILHLKFR